MSSALSWENVRDSELCWSGAFVPSSTNSSGAASPCLDCSKQSFITLPSSTKLSFKRTTTKSAYDVLTLSRVWSFKRLIQVVSTITTSFNTNNFLVQYLVFGTLYFDLWVHWGLQGDFSVVLLCSFVYFSVAAFWFKETSVDNIWTIAFKRWLGVLLLGKARTAEQLIE